MYSVTKKIEFCYGHRLLDYDGICKHPHGHNAVAEIEVRSGSLDNRNMVCDFSDIKRIVKGWVDRELDHKMILREDDPLVGPLQATWRARVHRAKQSHGGAYRQTAVRLHAFAGVSRRARHGVGNADVVRDLRRRGGGGLREARPCWPSSISTARSSTRAAISPRAPTRCSPVMVRAALSEE